MNEGYKKKNNNVLLTLICFGIITLVCYSVFSVFVDVYEKRNEKKVLSVKLYELREDNERLKVEVNRLKDIEYVARYVREKYLYSGKNEYVFRLK